MALSYELCIALTYLTVECFVIAISDHRANWYILLIEAVFYLNLEAWKLSLFYFSCLVSPDLNRFLWGVAFLNHMFKCYHVHENCGTDLSIAFCPGGA